jgi:hypothetical protein
MKKILDYTIEKDSLCNMSDKQLSELYMYTDRDKDEVEDAKKIYWWCVEEINRRIDKESGN